MVTLTPITDPAKLQEYFRFRYRIYSESRQKGFLGDQSGIDTDAFDARAMHYGWYVNSELTGCVRFVEPDCSDKPLPMFGYLMDASVIDAVCVYMAMRKAHDQRMVEASRFCLAPEQRGLRTAREFVLAMVMTMQPLGFEHGLFDCDINHAPFYRLLGFADLLGEDGFQMRGHGVRSTTMAYRYERVLSAAVRYNAGQGFRGRWEMRKAA